MTCQSDVEKASLKKLEKSSHRVLKKGWKNIRVMSSVMKHVSFRGENRNMLVFAVKTEKC